MCDHTRLQYFAFRSISASVEQPSEANEETSADNTSEIPPVPSVTATEKTPSRKRRSTRRSLAIAGTPRLSDIPEPLTEVEHDEEPKEAKTSVCLLVRLW